MSQSGFSAIFKLSAAQHWAPEPSH